MSRTPTIDTFYIAFNMDVPSRSRQAMAYVMTGDDFTESVFKGRGESAYHLTPPQIFPGGGGGYRPLAGRISPRPFRSPVLNRRSVLPLSRLIDMIKNGH